MSEEKETLPLQHSRPPKKRSSYLRLFIHFSIGLTFFILLILYSTYNATTGRFQFHPDHRPTKPDHANNDDPWEALERCPRPPGEEVLSPPPPRMRLRMMPAPHVYCYPRAGGVLVLEDAKPLDLEWLGLGWLPAGDVGMPGAGRGSSPGEGKTGREDGGGSSSSARGEEMGGGREEEGEGKGGVVGGQEVVAAAAADDQDEEDAFCDKLRLFVPTWFPREADALAPRWWEHPSWQSLNCYSCECPYCSNGVGYGGGCGDEMCRLDNREFVYEDFTASDEPPRVGTIGFSTKHWDGNGTVNGNATSSEAGNETAVWVYWDVPFDSPYMGPLYMETRGWKMGTTRGRQEWERRVCAWRIRAALSMEERCRIIEECGGERFEMEEWKKKAKELMEKMDSGKRVEGSDYMSYFY